ncbi:MAG: hypothetical protein KDD28_15110 [Phaeodactylibacter sp.]|nr:hypothetical protein [Phaeodactylibacter sp.]HQU61467.1 hypothetical protein [Saprospiraceae bacterium]
MAFYKRLNNGNPNDTIKVAAGMNNCCGASETVETYANTAHNATSTPITGIVIDGTTYTFTAAADTAAELITGVREAFTAAGYFDMENAGIATSGAATALVATIKTTATLTVFKTGGSDVTLTAA